MTRAFVSVGSNIEPARHLNAAVRMLAGGARVTGVSTVYLTAPEGRPEQPRYYNCVVAVEVDAPPAVVKRSLLAPIERALGRTRGADRFAARTIDLDLIVYGDLVVSDIGMSLPDPLILQRPFLAAALCELEPRLVLPGMTVPLAEATADLDRGGMEPLHAFTAQLREEVTRGTVR